MLSEELAENVNHRDRSRRCGITSRWSLKIVVGEVLSLRRCARNTLLHVCQVNVEVKKKVKSVCGAPNVCAGIKVMVALPVPVLVDNYKIKKGKIRGLESLGMTVLLGELGISDSVVPKAICGWHSNLTKMLFQDSLLPRLRWWNTELSITPNRADALSMRGVAHEVAAIYDKAVNFKDLRCLETVAADTFWGQILTQTRHLTMSARILDNVPSHQVHNGCKIFLRMKASVQSITWWTWPTTSYSTFGQSDACLWLGYLLKETTSVCVKRVLVKN